MSNKLQGLARYSEEKILKNRNSDEIKTKFGPKSGEIVQDQSK